MDLLDALKKNFKLTGDAILPRNSETARAIFKTSLSQDEFIRELNQQGATGDIEVTETFFRLRKQYPHIVDKASLLSHILKSGRFGILNDEALELSYRGIA